MTTKKKTHIALVLDSSGSMSSMKEQAIALFNEQRDVIHKDRRKGGTTRLSLVVFGESGAVLASGVLGNAMNLGATVRVVHDNVPTKDVPRLTEATYKPQSMTPMRDGIGRAIGLLEAHDDGAEQTAFLVVVVTDGQENASQEWTAAALSAKVAALQGGGRWTFALYGCADLDLAELKETAGLGAVPLANMGTYDRSAAGLCVGSMVLASNTSSYMDSRAVGLTASINFAVEDQSGS